MSKFQELSSLIWSVADDVLRGLFKPHEYGDVILPFVILRRLDCVIEPRKDEIYTLYEEYKTKVEDPSPVIRSRRVRAADWVGPTNRASRSPHIQNAAGPDSDIRVIPTTIIAKMSGTTSILMRLMKAFERNWNDS